MTYIIYGRATFSNQTRRNRVLNSIRNAATSAGLTPRTWNGYVGGTNPVATTGLTICYTTESFETVEQVERVAMRALASDDYDGDFGWQDMGLEQAQQR